MKITYDIIYFSPFYVYFIMVYLRAGITADNGKYEYQGTGYWANLQTPSRYKYIKHSGKFLEEVKIDIKEDERERFLELTKIPDGSTANRGRYIYIKYGNYWIENNRYADDYPIPNIPSVVDYLNIKPNETPVKPIAYDGCCIFILKPYFIDHFLSTFLNVLLKPTRNLAQTDHNT